MSIHVVSNSKTYRVTPDSNVTLRVTIGDAQGGGWIITRGDDTIIAKGSGPDLVAIGRGDELKGRVIQVVATAVDIRPETNRLSALVGIDGGSDGNLQILSVWDNGAAGDVAIFPTVVGFV
jgi:hypothetical protein